MFKVAYRELWARKRRLVTTGLAIVLGIAFLSGTQLLSGVLTQSIESLVTDLYDDIDVVVRSSQKQETQFGNAIRPSIDAALLGEIEQVDGVGEAVGIVETLTAQLVSSDGTMASAGPGPPTIVNNWYSTGDLALGNIMEGTPPTGAEDIVLDFKAAENAGYEIGDTVTILTPSGSEQFTLVGVLGRGVDGEQPSGVTVLGFETSVAQQIANTPEQFNYIAVIGENGLTQTELTAAVAEQLPDYEVITGETFVQESQDEISQFVDILSILVSIFGYISLFVATFIIYNTFSILISQRTRETALLRAIGASRKQVLLAAIAEAVVIGIISSIIGLGLGYVLALGLKQAVGSFFSIPFGLPPLSPSIVGSALLIGIGVTVLSAAVPAYRSTRIPPIAALSEVSVDRSAVSGSRKVWGVILFALGIAIVFLGLSEWTPQPILVLGLGAVITLTSLSLVLGPVLIGPMTAALTWPIFKLRRAGKSGVVGALAAQNATRNPKRSAATAAALTIGVTVVTLIAILASSLKASVDSATAQSTRSDFVVASAMASGGMGMPVTLIDEIRELDDVALASQMRVTPGRLIDVEAPEPTEPGAAPEGADTFVIGVDPATFLEVLNTGDVQGDIADATAGTVMADAGTAENGGWELGDMIPMYFASVGVVELELVTILGNAAGPLGVLVPLEDFEKYALDMFQFDYQIYVQAAEGADLDDLRVSLEAVTEDLPVVKVQDLQEYIASQTAPIDLFLNIVYSLLTLAIVIALIGITNTLSLSIMERVRELGLLRAVGMSKSQLRRCILGESVIISLFGSVLGMGLGVVFSLALTTAMVREVPDIFVYNLPVMSLLVILAVACLAGIIAAITPAYRASKLDVLESISHV